MGLSDWVLDWERGPIRVSSTLYHSKRPSTGTGPVSEMEEYQAQLEDGHWLRFWNGARSGVSILE